MPPLRPEWEDTTHGDAIPNVPDTWWIDVNAAAEEWITQSLGPTGSGSAVVGAPSADRLTIAVALADAGFDAATLPTAIAIAYTSGAGIMYYHRNFTAGTPGYPGAGYERGPLGLEYPAGPSLSCALRLDCAARFFRSITLARGWAAHGTYRNGTYQSAMEQATIAAQQYEQGDWRLALPGGPNGGASAGEAGYEIGWTRFVNALGTAIPSHSQFAREVGESFRNLRAP